MAVRMGAPTYGDRPKHLIEFGYGKTIVDVGTYGGKHAVFIEPAKVGGHPGADARHEQGPLNRVHRDAIILTFPSEDRARAVLDALFVGVEIVEP